MLTDDLRANFWHLYADVLWYGLLAGSTMAFLAIFAARQGASGFEVSLLTAGPAVVNLAFSLSAGDWLKGRPLVGTTYLAALLSRLWYLALILLPWFLSARGQVWGVIWITLLMSIPGTVLAIGFNALLADAVPPEWRGHVVGRRIALLALSTAIASILSGLLLDHIVFPINYQIVFGMGAVGALMSTYHLSRVRLSLEAPLRVGRLLRNLMRKGIQRLSVAIHPATGLRLLPRWGDRSLLRLEILRGPARYFMAAYLFFYACQYTGIPIFPLYYVHELKLTDGEISLGSALFYATVLLVSMQLRRISDRFGHRGALVSGALIFGVYPLLLGVAQGVGLFLVASLLGGIAWSIAYGGLVNRLMERSPDDDRRAFMAIHNLALNLGILGGSLVGPLLDDWLGLRLAMFVVAGLRLLAGALLAVWA
jgi:MFS family permease